MHLSGELDAVNPRDAWLLFACDSHVWHDFWSQQLQESQISSFCSAYPYSWFLFLGVFWCFCCWFVPWRCVLVKPILACAVLIITGSRAASCVISTNFNHVLCWLYQSWPLPQNLVARQTALKGIKKEGENAADIKVRKVRQSWLSEVRFHQSKVVQSIVSKVVL